MNTDRKALALLIRVYLFLSVAKMFFRNPRLSATGMLSRACYGGELEHVLQTELQIASALRRIDDARLRAAVNVGGIPDHIENRGVEGRSEEHTSELQS